MQDEGQADVLTILRSAGVDAVAIPESEIDQPDILIRHSAGDVLIEVKTKFDHEKYATKLAGDLARDGRAIRVAAAVEHKPYRRESQTSAKQLRFHENSATSIKVMWVRCCGIDPYEQFLMWPYTLYGIAPVADMDAHHEHPNTGSLFDVVSSQILAVPAFYYHESVFFRHRLDIDAAMIEYEGRLTLFVNDMSPNAALVGRSAVGFGFAHSIFNPRENSNEILYVEGDHPRADIDESNRILARIYGMGSPRAMPLERYQVFISTV